jgi:hypothetical protein
LRRASYASSRRAFLLVTRIPGRSLSIPVPIFGYSIQNPSPLYGTALIHVKDI